MFIAATYVAVFFVIKLFSYCYRINFTDFQLYSYIMSGTYSFHEAAFKNRLKDDKTNNKKVKLGLLDSKWLQPPQLDTFIALKEVIRADATAQKTHKLRETGKLGN